MKNKHSMTSGSIWKSLVAFAIPLVLGNLFQQLYNVVDSIIVGNYVGKEALAAVGASGSIIILLVGFFMGAATGAGIITSQFFGAKNEKGIHKAVHTSLAIALVGGVIIAAAGIALTPLMLKVIDTPDDVFDQAVIYQRIYLGGAIFATIYNMSAGILNAAGNSRRSLVYLIIASITNAVLDLVFVGIFKWGIVGAAVASDISQLVSCIFIVRYLIRSREPYHVSIKDIRFYDKLPGRILKVGLPSGIQSVVISISNVIVQASVNGFGSDVMAAYTTYNRVEGFMLLPIMSLGMAATTYTGQNYGANEIERIHKGSRVSTGIGVLYAIVVAAIMYFAAPYIIAIFSTESKVIETGVFMLNCMLPAYWLLAVFNIKVGTIRGAGKTMEAMLISVFSLCVVRIVWIIIVFADSHNLFLLMVTYPVTWLVGAAIAAIYEKKGKWLVEPDYEFLES